MSKINSTPIHFSLTKDYLKELQNESSSFLEEGFELIALHSASEIMDANDAILGVLGYSLSEIKGLNAWKLFDQSSVETIYENLKLKSEAPYDVVALSKDGEEIQVTIWGKNLVIDGLPCRLIGAKLR